ncbi:HEAT repeat domain-containing protein [Streptomyces sp. NPDC051940]|uniref:HEAT repeat domain-containing protein n=1 Tax=Streptomyces sp. NPDC051940 TaxID=3155675 RepID=UPI003420D7A9
MFQGLDDIDWASMEHAYGSAENVPGMLRAMRSPDAQEREQAFGEFYGAVHHQGDVYLCTAASVPFLFELAGDGHTPDRAAVVGLLVSIGREAVARGDVRYEPPLGHPQAAARMRAWSEAFVGFARDADVAVRRAAIPAVGLFPDDADRAAAVLRDRLPAESGIVERLLVVESMADLALRLPACAAEAAAWLAGLAADTAVDPATRLAAVVHRARCDPERIGEDAVPAAIALLRGVADTPVPAEEWASPPTAEPSRPADAEVRPQDLAAFEHLDRLNRVYAPTTELLRAFHTTLGPRVSQRTALLLAQLRSPDPGSRLDAIRMGADLIRGRRGDHTALVRLLAGRLRDTDHEVAAEAATALQECRAIAEPAREALAAHVAAQRAEHGREVWAAPDRRLRRSHQEAVRALAGLGDVRAVPSLLTALDGGVDRWRAVEVAGTVREAAGELAPRLCAGLRRAHRDRHGSGGAEGPLLRALAALGDPVAVPLIAAELSTSDGQWSDRGAALAGLASFGPAAASALDVIRDLAASRNRHVRPAAVAALWAVGRDHEEVLPHVLDLLGSDPTTAAGLLAEIGPPAAAALPRLRELLTDRYEWVRVHSAAALWEIAGDAEAPAVLDTLLRTWEEHPHTARGVLACLDRMGRAAEPALPLVRRDLAAGTRPGVWGDVIGEDEKRQRLCRTLIGRLS